MEESDSLCNSSIHSHDSDEPTCTRSSTEADEELCLSSPTEVSPYHFEPPYNSDDFYYLEFVYSLNLNILELAMWGLLTGKLICTTLSNVTV